MDLIKKWLSGRRNYYVGAVLYKQFGYDDKLKALFSGEPNPRLQERLEEELSNLLKMPAKAEKPETDISLSKQAARVHQLEDEVKMLEDEVRTLSCDSQALEEKTLELEDAVADLRKMEDAIKELQKTKSDASEMPESQDPVLKALRLEWLVPYQRMNYLRHELDRYQADSPEDTARRKALATEILELEQACMQIWERREAYLKDGNLPEVKTGEVDIPTDAVALGKLIESTKRNIRRNKQLATRHPDNPVYPLKARHYEEQLQQILKKTTGHEGN